MTDDDRIAALFADEDRIADDGFTRRVLALAALEERIAENLRAARVRIGVEAAALGGVLAAFAALSRIDAPSAVVPLASPAMVGLMLLGSWLAFGLRGNARA